MMKRLSFALCVAAGLVASTLLHQGGVHAQTASVINGIPNQSTAMSGVLPIYDLSGNIITGAKCFQGTVTSAATTGQWSVPNSPASLGLTSVTSVTVTVVSPGGSLTLITGQYGYSLQNASTSAINGTVTSPALVAVGGYAIGFGPSPATVYVRFCGGTS